MNKPLIYSLSANLSPKGQAVFAGAYAGRKVVSECNTCKTRVTEPNGTIMMKVAPTRGSFWPDATFCFGDFYGIYVSQRVRDGLDAAGVRFGRAFPAKVEGSFPKKLENTNPPSYFYLTGEFGAKFDFSASGYQDFVICSTCGRVKLGPAAVRNYSLIEGSWNGSDIFYTDLSSSVYFCTERIVELGRLNRWSNFGFVPLAEMHDSANQGIDYLSR